MRISKNIDFIEILNTSTEEKNIFLDIETFQYNELEGYKKPSNFKNMIFSLTVSTIFNNIVYCKIFNNFYDFLNSIKIKDTKFNVFIHNGFKYDNHFLLWELKYYYKLPVYNLLLDSEVDECKKLSYKEDEINTDCAFQKRIKSKNNLDLIVKLNGNVFHFYDTYLKSNCSLRTIGKKLHDAKLIDEKYLKTDFDYTKYNLTCDMSDFQAKKYAKKIYINLNEDEKTYIYNDVIILAFLYKYFNVIFKDFDIQEITFSQNVLKKYIINDFTKFQLLQKIDKYNYINNTEFDFKGENFYNYLKKYYKGGLNFYNDIYLGKVVNCDGFSVDINSSYPAIMYKDKIPTFLKNYAINKKINVKDVLNSDNYFLFEISKKEFNTLLNKTTSINVTKILVKYYNNFYKNVYINSNTLKIMTEIFKMDIKEFYALSFLEYECYDFGGKEIINDFYKIKQCGKSNTLLDYISADNISFTKFKNETTFSSEEVYISKVCMNGIYGIPALRAFFNNFKEVNNNFINFENGYKNSERNIIFSIYVTSKALYNLLLPLKNLSNYEIDNVLLYTDTDSLYFKSKSIIKKFDKNLINDLNIGCYSFDCKDIKQFYVLNHKKYCYYDNVKNKITLKCGGIPLKSFNTDRYSNLEDFVKNEFSQGVNVTNQKSILNKHGTISIYQSVTKLEKGEVYPIRFLTYDKEKLKNDLLDIEDNDINEGLYIETNIGAFSINEILNTEPKFKKGYNIKLLKILHEEYKARLKYD